MKRTLDEKMAKPEARPAILSAADIMELFEQVLFREVVCEGGYSVQRIGS